MRPFARASAIAHVAVAVLVIATLAPRPAAALDCAPQFNWNCATHGFFNYVTGQPGEVLCGTDYTGWTFTVVNVTMAQGGWVHFVATAGIGINTQITAAIIQMGDCGAGTCIDSAQSGGVTEFDACLDTGAHTFIVATNSTAPNAILNMDLMCLTCAQAETMGLVGCPACGAVGDETSSWGSLKAQFK